ncbi:unnamed protein product [Adineta ricciae]|uniref:Uncharacterized protein n=1 Tax=Adineta ricciae TaxID=249248 RepID=A0A815DDB3_ADIRI|nr:unnamed protein product [Adineta ricciae]
MILFTKELKSDDLVNLKEQCNRLIGYVQELQEKASLIDHLYRLHFKYVNVCDSTLDHINNKQTIEQKLVRDMNTDRIICSTTPLENKYREQLGNFRQKLMREYKNNSGLRLIYGNFSYSSYKLLIVVVIPLDWYDHKSSKLNYNTTPEFRHGNTQADETNHIIVQLNTKYFARPSSGELTELQDHKTVSILLLQSSGVGKSTFTNAFTNYLRFNTFDDAQAGKPLVLIPVSFSITTCDDFEEHMIYLHDAILRVFAFFSNQTNHDSTSTVVHTLPNYSLFLERKLVPILYSVLLIFVRHFMRPAILLHYRRKCLHHCPWMMHCSE